MGRFDVKGYCENAGIAKKLIKRAMKYNFRFEDICLWLDKVGKEQSFHKTGSFALLCFKVHESRYCDNLQDCHDPEE